MNALKPQLSVVFAILFCLPLFGQTITGELRKWHTITLTYTGPNTSESNSENPFLNYRLNVTFTSPTGKIWVVPGFYAADGNAAETSADSGNKWRVHFTPNETGTWTYDTSFRTGTEVAIKTEANAGNATSFNGTSGNFTISSSNKLLPDNRAKGRLNYVGEHYLKFEETDAYFIKVGADSPENLLAYDDFDNTVATKDWSPHTGDWNAGDPEWKNGNGKGIIGAINYLSSQGMNAFSFLTMNVNGDGKDVWPWSATNNSALGGSNQAASENRLRYDVSKLAQWEILFSHADTKGMFLHFKTQETENDQLLDGGGVEVERKLYYRELVARFGHHLSLNWNMGEENSQTAAQQRQMADYINNIDPYNHHVVLHTYPNEKDTHYPNIIGPEYDYTGPSLQSQINNIHNDVKEWLEASVSSGKKWAVANDEQGNAQAGVTADASFDGNKGNQSDNRANVRHKVLWGTLLAGGYGVEYYFGYGTGETDLTAEDFRSRKTKWEDAKIAKDFFEQHIPFWEMQTDDNLTPNSDEYCFANRGEYYVVYLPDGGSTTLNLSHTNNSFDIFWYDPRNGGNLKTGTKTLINGGATRNLGQAPSNTNSDWVVLLKNNGGGNSGSGTNGDCEAQFAEENGILVVEAENLDLPTGWNVKSTVNDHTGSGYIEWLGGNSFSQPGNGLISVPIQINTPGTYIFKWRTKVGNGTNSTEHNDSWLRFPDADDFYGEKVDGSRVYPNGSGKTPNPNGASSNGWFKVYLSGTTDWTWVSATSDHDAHSVYAQFDSAGVYTMEISGRSDNHLIDRITLAKDNGNATNTSLDETVCEGGQGSSNQPPNANATSDKTLGAAPFNVSFNANASTDDNEIISYEWDFGDGNTSNSKNPQHTFMTPGNYTVVLTVADEQGLTDNDTINITAQDGSNNLALTHLELINAVTDSKILDLANGMTISSDQILSSLLTIEAKFNDNVGSVVFSLTGGKTAEKTENLPPYTLFANTDGDYQGEIFDPGNYVLDIEVYSETNGNGTILLSETVGFSIAESNGNLPPLALIDADKTSGQAPLEIQFSGSNSIDDQQITSFEWDFGDGNSSSEENPKHTFTNPGVYDVVLTVYDSQGLLDTDMVSVTVLENGTDTQNLISSFSIVNSITKEELFILEEGMEIPINLLPRTGINIKANIASESVESIDFNLTGDLNMVTSEETAPFMLFGDIDGTYNAGDLPIGEFTLNAVPYTTNGSTSKTDSTASTVSFSIVPEKTAANSGELEAFIYPNPAVENINIKLRNRDAEIVRVDVHDFNGRSVAVRNKSEINSVEQNNASISVSHLKQGVYFIWVYTDNNETAVAKLLIAD